MKTDVFVRVWASSLLRLALAQAVIERLRADPAVRLTLIVAEPSHRAQDWGKHEVVFQLDTHDFHRRSKAIPEELARGDPYVVIDDDHMPIGTDWLQQGLETLRERPNYAFVASWSINGAVFHAALPRRC